MSDLLKQAIIDSEALKEAAIKNAQKSLANKYNPVVEKVVTEMLEDNEEEMDIPFAFDDNDEEIDIDLTSMSQQDISEDCVGEGCADKDKKVVEEEASCEKCNQDPCTCEKEAVDESAEEKECTCDKDPCVCDKEDVSIEESEEELEEYEKLLELLQTDLKPHKRGFMQDPESENLRAEKEGLATVVNDEEEKEDFEKLQTALKQAHKEEVNEYKGLVRKYQGLLKEAMTCLEESNLVQAKLQCQNKILMDTSLNEQQKNRIVESVGKVKTTEQVELVYGTLCETLKSGVVGQKNSKVNLNEALLNKGKQTRHIKESKKEEKDPFRQRMLELALTRR